MDQEEVLKQEGLKKAEMKRMQEEAAQREANRQKQLQQEVSCVRWPGSMPHWHPTLLRPEMRQFLHKHLLLATQIRCDRAQTRGGCDIDVIFLAGGGGA